ncbi:MAG: hypothetical protein J6C28_06660 [Bacilli bacterium]|nr:hypothetical protein [Bacilli bacterium]
MKKFINIFSTYFLPVIVIGTVVIICILFLLANLPYDNNAINVELDRQKVVVSNGILMSDDLGKKISIDNTIDGTTGYVDFNIESKVDGKVKYEIVLVKEDSEPEIDMKFVKVHLTDINDNDLKNNKLSKIPTYYDLRVSDTDPSGKVVYSGYLKDKENQSFRLRMWVSDTYEIIAEKKIFAVKLKVNVK